MKFLPNLNRIFTKSSIFTRFNSIFTFSQIYSRNSTQLNVNKDKNAKFIHIQIKLCYKKSTNSGQSMKNKFAFNLFKKFNRHQIAMCGTETERKSKCKSNLVFMDSSFFPFHIFFLFVIHVYHISPPLISDIFFFITKNANDRI